MKKIISVFLLNILVSGLVMAQQDHHYQATFFGVVSDGINNNTTAIQSAIDYISAKGGGTLSFYVGRYLTGGLELKSNVTIDLHEGAILVATPNVNDYPVINGKRAFLQGSGISNIKITGKGVIEANPDGYYELLNDLKDKKLLSPEYLNPVPALVGLDDCNNVEVSGIILQKAFKSGISLENCSDVRLDSLTIRHNFNKGGNGISLTNTQVVNMTDLFVDPGEKALIKDKTSRIKLVKRAITPDGKSIL